MIRKPLMGIETMKKLEGRTAIITGAGNGIGRAIALAYAAEGAAVACADIAMEDAEKVAAEINAGGGKAIACDCDVSRPEQAEAAVNQTVEALGGVTILVCGAAVFTPMATLETLSVGDWEKAMAVNLGGAFLMCKFALPHLRQGGGGSIILIASQLGRVATAGQTAYCTTKGALLQLAKGLALDHREENIRANTLSPGAVATRRMLNRFDDMETAQRVWGAKHALGRLGEPEEIASAAVFLASADSSFMTGTDLLVDGGYTAW